MSLTVQNMFSKVTHTYEMVNRILTFGLDTIWRKTVSRMVAKRGGTKWLDVCTGTGETATYLNKRSNENQTVFAVDFSLPMLQEATSKHETNGITFTLADAKSLPFPDESFDVVTISFATRNITTNRDNLILFLREFRRVLKPDGLFLNIETSQPPSSMIRRLFHLYARRVISTLGYLISGSRSGYTYLSSTIRRFFEAEEFAEVIREAGFKHVDFHRMLLGIIAIHRAVK
ncbi:MAG: ubiquinone/menaquinone biosynthesis methyltransferase [Candidatus Thorarchaeota archaeon]